MSESGHEKTDVDTQASRFFDIEILVTGEDRTVSKIEPAAPVQVSMLLPEAVPEAAESEAAESEAAVSEETASEEAVSEEESGKAQKADLRVLHFVKNGVEQVDPAAVTRDTFEAVSDAFTEGNGDETDRDAGAETRVSRDNDPAFEDCEVIQIRFEAGSFSVYGIVYTVYTVDSVDSRYESRDEKENEKEKEPESIGLSLSKKGGSSKALRGPAEDSQPMNLAEFVTDAVIEIEGRTYSGGETWTVHEDVKYALTLTFKEKGARQFPQGGKEMVMDPDDLDGMNLVPGQSGSFDIPMGLYGAVTGNQWWVDDDGRLHIQFGDDPDKLLTRSNNAYIKLSFNVNFHGTEGEIHFNDTAIRDWEANTETDVSVTKSGHYNASTGKMEYTVTVTSTGHTSNVTVTDTFAESNLLTLDQSSITITPEKELAESGNYTGPDGFIRVIKEMAHGEKVTITYTADVNESALEPNGRVKGDDGKNNIIVEDDEGDEDETTNIVHEIKFSDLDKLTTSQTETADGKIRMSWLITANTQRRASLVGSTVSDRIDPASKDIMKYVKADGKVQLHVTGTDGEGNTYSRIIEVTPGDDQGQESWIWTVENIGEPQGTPLSYSIAYDTIAEKQTDNTAVKNDAENSSGGSDTGVGAVPGTDPGSGIHRLLSSLRKRPQRSQQNTLTGILLSMFQYADTGFTRTVVFPTTAGKWETTIKDLLRKDADGNLYRYYITEDSCSPAAVSVEFADQDGNDIRDEEETEPTTDPLTDDCRSLVVTNTYETTDFIFTKEWHDTGDRIDNTWHDNITVSVQRRIGSGTAESVGKYTIQQGDSGFTITKDATTPEAPDLVDLVSDTGFTFKISNLQKNGRIGDDTGEYVYFVTEETVNGYRDAVYSNPSVSSAEGETAWIPSTEYALNNGRIINRPEDSFELPSTGGPGTALFRLTGIMLTGLAGAVLIMRKRRRPGGAV